MIKSVGSGKYQRSRSVGRSWVARREGSEVRLGARGVSRHLREAVCGLGLASGGGRRRRQSNSCIDGMDASPWASQTHLSLSETRSSGDRPARWLDVRVAETHHRAENFMAESASGRGGDLRRCLGVTVRLRHPGGHEVVVRGLSASERGRSQQIVMAPPQGSGFPAPRVETSGRPCTPPPFPADFSARCCNIKGRQRRQRGR
jgi:hypothetical protein